MTQNNFKLLRRSSNFLNRIFEKPAWKFDNFVSDPRNKRGQRWKLPTLMDALLLGMLVNRSSLRSVESLTELTGKSLGKSFKRKVPDSTLYDLLGNLDPGELRTQLHAQIRTLARSKSLEPVRLPCGVLAIDNKTIWSGKPDEAEDPNCQLVRPKDRAPYSQLRVVRSVLISAAGKPVIDQEVIRKETNEGGMFEEVFQRLLEEFNWLFEIASLDAGFCSLKNANLIAAAGKGYIFGLKGNQPELYLEAQRVLGGETQPELSTDWERYKGNKIRYHLYRTKEMAGYLSWSHLEQVWRVEKEIIDKEGKRLLENHYYATNLHWGRLSGKQILQVVRGHWGIENNSNWSLDCIWDEDTKSWSTKGLAIQVLGLLRLMAYNLVAHLRDRYLRKRREKHRWGEWFDWLFLVVTKEEVQSGKQCCVCCGG